MVERVHFYKNCLLQMLQVLVASVEVYLSEFNLAAAGVAIWFLTPTTMESSFIRFSMVKKMIARWRCSHI